MYNTSCLKITAFRGCPRFLKNNKSFPIPLNPSPLLLSIQHFLSLEAFWSFRKLTLQRLWRDVFIKETNSGNKKVWLLVVSAFTGGGKKKRILQVDPWLLAPRYHLLPSSPCSLCPSSCVSNTTMEVLPYGIPVRDRKRDIGHYRAIWGSLLAKQSFQTATLLWMKGEVRICVLWRGFPSWMV